MNLAILESEHIQTLLDVLRKRGYQVIGPTLGEGAIVYDELNSIANLPVGWTDEQDGGNYRLKKREDNALFGYTVGPHSWKKLLFPSLLRLWQAKRNGSSFQIVTDNEADQKFAFIGVRSCDIHAISIQDKVFMGGQYIDPYYKLRREDAFVIAVNCGKAGGTCFCVSMNTGPRATFGFDLALTEIIESDSHYFLVETGTELGAEILREIPHKEANEKEKCAADSIVKKTSEQMGRFVDTTNIKDLFYRNYEHPRWNNVAERCLNCANCTMVCPTCFCTTVEDVTDLTGDNAERWRKWDSCFTMDFSYIHGGSVRSSTKSRYRHWITHKLATWIDQFGTSGCVGCGRCMTWCPVAIDITEEVEAIRKSEPVIGKQKTLEAIEK
ncbi:MAG TPA: 4Fe-4S dicluster domain-containing protein [Candidatus Brocadiaceae bacterium]|nr:4Fe-4S dicluster domain-containing protein [Candidatus Brocadiaceae bacterium]